MKKNVFSFTFLVVALLVGSCKKELTGINQNPNASQTAQPDYQLSGTIKSVADIYTLFTTAQTINESMLFVQYWSKIQYTDPDRYIFSNNDFQELWTIGYSNGIINSNQIFAAGIAENNTNYQGVALVLRSWVFSLLTDAYGDIPYSQAAAIDKYLSPAYDGQRDVYLGLLADLKKAQTLLTPSSAKIGGDLIYQGNILSWKHLANSLRLRIALRISDREPAIASQTLQDIAAEGSGYIASNAETAQLTYLDSPNQNPISNLFDTRDDYRISKTMVDKLDSLSDPRLPVYASPTKNPTPKTYVGIPNGLLVGDASSLGFNTTSRPGQYFLAPHAPAVILSYSELLFDRAEAAARGFTSENPQELYLGAIQASLNQYQIAPGLAATYLSSPLIAYNPVNFKQSIGVQKWIALYGEGPEAFAEWRRLKYPVLKPAVAGVLNGAIPRRFIYPGTEQALNGKSYTAAVSHQGPDLLTTRLWFDVQ